LSLFVVFCRAGSQVVIRVIAKMFHHIKEDTQRTSSERAYGNHWTRSSRDRRNQSRLRSRFSRYRDDRKERKNLLRLSGVTPTPTPMWKTRRIARAQEAILYAIRRLQSKVNPFRLLDAKIKYKDPKRQSLGKPGMMLTRPDEILLTNDSLRLPDQPKINLTIPGNP
jgi:hypothetical protein